MSIKAPKEERKLKEIDREIQHIKKIRKGISEKYLNEEIGFQEYQRLLKNKIGTTHPDKRLLELYEKKRKLKERQGEEAREEAEKAEVGRRKEKPKARKNIPRNKNINRRRKRAITIALIGTLVFLSIFGWNILKNGDGITGYTIINDNTTNRTTEEESFEPQANQSVESTTEEGEEADSETINETQEEGSNTTTADETEKEQIEGVAREENQSIEEPIGEQTEEDNQATTESINETTNATRNTSQDTTANDTAVNETQAELNDTINQTINQTTDEITNETRNETVVEENESIEENLTSNQTIPETNITANQSTNETINTTEPSSNITTNQTTSQTNETNLTQEPEEGINETPAELNETIKQSINETTTTTLNESMEAEETINQTINETTNRTQPTSNKTQQAEVNETQEETNESIEPVENQSINATISNETINLSEGYNQTIEEINITTIASDNQTYTIYPRKNYTEEYNIQEIINTSASLFLATSTNHTDVEVVGTTLIISRLDNVETDRIKIKSILNSTIIEHKVNIKYVDANFTKPIEINESIENQTINQTTEPENQTQEIETDYIKREVRIGAYESQLIDLKEHFDLEQNSNFVATTRPAIDAFVEGNYLIVTLFKPEKIENYKEQIKLYHEENRTLKASYLNITILSQSPFSKLIGILSTNESSLSFNPNEYLNMHPDNTSITCLNNYFQTEKEKDNFTFINQRNLPLRDNCFLEVKYGEEKHSQAFEVRMNLEREQLGIFNETTTPIQTLNKTEKPIILDNDIKGGISFSIAKKINISELREKGEQSFSFKNQFSPDAYEIHFIKSEEDGNQTIILVERRDLEQGGLTGAFIGAGAVIGRIANALTNFVMSVINFFSGGITGQTIAEENSTNNTSPEEPIENTNNGSTESPSKEEIEENQTTDNVDYEENTTEPIEEQTNATPATQTEDNTEIETNESIIETENLTNDETDNITTNQTTSQTNETNLTQEPEEGINETLTELNDTINQSINQTTEEITNETKSETFIEENESIEENLTSNQTTPETNITINQTINETINITEPSSNETSEDITNQTTDQVEQVEEEPITEEEIQQEETEESQIEETQQPLQNETMSMKLALERYIESMFISNNNTLIVEVYEGILEELNTTNLSRYLIRADFIANNFETNLSKISEDRFTEEYIIEIYNPYNYDFANLSLTLSVPTNKTNIKSANHKTEILGRNESSVEINIKDISLPRQTRTKIGVTALSPTFEYKREDIAALCTLSILRRQGNSFSLEYIQREGENNTNISNEIELKKDINISCERGNIISEYNKENKMINLNLSECNSSFSIEINKKEVEGIWLEHNEYKVYEDMSSRIVLLPDNIFLRGNCIECLSKNICQPKSFCPLTNSGQRGWDFVGDLIFNISNLETAIAGKIQEADLCLYNTYASSNSSINTYIKTIESSICEPLYQRINVEELKNSTDIPRITRKEQTEEVFKPEWICTDIKSIIEEKISKDNATNQLTLRLIGEDMKNTNQPFTCFDSGISSIPECDRKAPQTCSPYINISYTYE